MISIRKLNAILKSRFITGVVGITALIIVFAFCFTVSIEAKKNITQAEIRTDLIYGFKQLDQCLQSPKNTKYDDCLIRLSFVSKALDKYKGATPTEAIAWGAAQSYLFSLKSSSYPFHKTLAQWAITEQYITPGSYTPETFQAALSRSYIKNKPAN